MHRSSSCTASVESFIGTVPTDMYWQPAYYDREMEAIYKRAWLNVGRVEQVVVAQLSAVNSKR